MNRHRTILTTTAMAAFLFGLATTLESAERFDMQVRGDFFAGMAGNKEAMERAMTKTEAVLAADPKHAEARVWYGGGLMSMAGQAFQKGDPHTGMSLFARGQKEMDDAVAQQPDNLAVRIPRGAVLLSAGRSIAQRNPEHGNPLIAKALTDYEFAYEHHKDKLTEIGSHPAGELLFGLADANSRLGNTERAAEFFDRIAALLPDTPYAKRAALWKETKSLPLEQTRCVGCHVAGVK